MQPNYLIILNFRNDKTPKLYRKQKQPYFQLKMCNDNAHSKLLKSIIMDCMNCSTFFMRHILFEQTSISTYPSQHHLGAVL